MARAEKTAAPPVRERIIDALMELAAEGRWDEIEIGDIAARAGCSLADFRDAFPSRGAVLGGLARRIDRAVLEGSFADLRDEPARDRVFDVMMRRIDALTPYKAALRQIVPALKRDPLAAAAMNQVALNSMRFMLAAAGIDTEDRLGMVKLQGAVLVFARTLEVWLEDDEPGLSKTMSALDRELARGEKVLDFAGGVARVTAPFRAFFEAACDTSRRMRGRMRERPRRGNDDDDVIAA
jgi:AcrR family transcriptional regulator